MPDDKLPIPQFAAKIKAKYPAYKDVNDTLLVQKILAKYPEYESQVDMSGLSTVKKKETVSQPTGFGSSIGGQVGTSVPLSEEDKIKSLLSTVKHSPTTPEDIERNERWKKVMHPELQITDADFQQDPVAAANRIILSRTPGVKNRQVTVSSTAVDTPLGAKIAAKEAKPLPKTEAIPFKDAEDKIKEVRNYFSENTNTSLEHLKQLTGASNGDQLYNEDFDEIIKQSIRPGNETDRIAYDRLQVAKAARKSIAENVARGRGLEDMAFDFAAANDPENAAIIQELKKTPSFNELLQGVTSVDRKAEDAFGNATVGQFLYQFLGNTAVQQELARIPGMTQQARNAANELLDEYPEFGRRYLGQMISQKMEDLGINNSILNVATKEERDRAVAALVKEGKMTPKEEAFYKENIRPLSGVGLLLRKVTGNPIIDTPGGIENALSGAYQGFKGLPKGLYEATFKDAVLGQQGALAKDFEMANRQVGVKPKGLMHEIVQSGGQFLGQSLSIGGGGNILKNAKILTNPKAAMAVAGGMQAFANYMPYARQVFPGNQLKQQGFATILSGLEMATENIFNDRKVVDGLVGKLKPGVAETIEQFTAKKISAEAARQQVEGLIRKAIRDLPDAAKYFSKGVGQNTVEEVVARLGQQVTEGVFSNKPISEWVSGEDLWNTARQAFLGSGFIAGLSTRADMQKNRGITAKTIYTMAEDPEYWKGQMREAGRLMPPEQANDIQDKINNLDKAAKIVAELEGTNLTQKQKVKFLITKLEQDIKDGQTKEAVIPAIQERSAKGLEKVQEDLLDGKDDGTIEGDQSDELTPAEMKAVKIAAKDPLPGVYQEQLDNDPIGVIRDIAEQAQGVSSDGTPLNGGSRTNDLLAMGVSQKFIDAAIEAFPVEKPQTTNIETSKAVMEGGVMSEVDINDEKIQLPEPGFVIGDVYLKEGEEKGKGSGQELYKNALDKHGVLYSFNPVSEDALRVQDKLVEKGIAKVEVIELSDGTQVRKITKAEPPPPEPPTPPKGEEGGLADGFELSFTGLQGMADEFGFEQVRSRDRVSDAQEIENARNTANEWKDKGVYEKNVQDLLKKIENRELVPTAAQRLLLQQYIANKKHELSLIEDKASKEFNDKLQEVKRLKSIGQIARQEAGAALRIGGATQSHPVEDLSDAIIGMQEANGVEELTKEQTAQVEKLVNDYQQKTKEAEERIAELEAKLAEMEAAKAVGEAKKYKKAARQKIAEQFKQERGRIVEDIREKLKKARGETNVTGVPYLKELIAIAPDVKKLVSNLVEQGITELTQIIDDIHEYLKDEITGITKGDVRDIIAGKYDEKRPTKSQLQQQLRDIRDEADLLRKLEELENGVEPASERKRVERNQRIKILRDRIRIIQHRNNYVSPGEKRLQDEINRNKKQEEKIRKDIEDGNFAQPEKATKWTQSDDLKKNFPKLYNEALDALSAKEDAKRDYDVAQFKAQQAKRGKIRKGIDLVRALIATSKAIKSGIDDSAIMVQNAVAMISHPRSAIKALREHALDAISEKRFRRYLTELHQSPIWNLMQKSGLGITDPKTLNEQNREEVFDNNLLNKGIKIKGKKYNIGKYVTRPFERAFTSLGNAMRVNMFTKITERMMAEGKTFETHPEEFKSLATVLNTETGRGKLHTQIQRASQLVTAGIWSPRLMASRLNMLGLSELAPLYGGKGYYKGLTPEMRKMAIQDMVKFISAGIAFMAFAGSRGAEIDDDPESPTFGTIQVGEKKYNAWGGMTPYVKAIVQGTTGKRNIRGERKPVTRSKIIGSFFRSRLTPAAGVTTDLITGKDFSGKPITTEGELMNLAAPLSISGIIDGVKKDGMIGILTQGLPSFIGIGVSDERDFAPSDSKKSIKLKYKDPKTRKPISRESTPEEYKKYVEEKGKIFDASLKKYTPESDVYFDEYGEISLSRTRSIKKYKSITDDQKKELETKLKRRSENEAHDKLLESLKK